MAAFALCSLIITLSCIAFSCNPTIKIVSGLGRGPCMDSLSLLRPHLRPTSCGERVAVCCVLVGMGMCGRVGKQAVVWLVNSQDEGPFILV